MKVLDCTLRDGGYYTNWDFTEEFVVNYLEAIEYTDVEYIEIGYRSMELDEYKGEYYYLPKSRISWVRSRTSKKLAVMLDVKNLKLRDLPVLLDGLQEDISLVRLATTVESYQNLSDYVRDIKNMGYDVAINFMRLSEWIYRKDLLQRLFKWSREAQVKYVYLVDSYGAVFPEELVELKSLMAKNSDLKFGFHAHDNISLGFSNALKAIELKFEVLDATFMGMGRGAGNLKTELLIQYLRKGELRPYGPSYYVFLDMISKLQAKYSWGTSHSYITAALSGFPQGKIMDLLNLRNSSKMGIDNIIIKSDTIKSKLSFEERWTDSLNNPLIIGGGNSSAANSRYVLNYASRLKCDLLFTSSKNIQHYLSYNGRLFLVLVGDELDRFNSLNIYGNVTFVANVNDSNTIIPESEEDVVFIDSKEVSRTGLALDVITKAKCKEVEIVGYDGYEGEITSKEATLALENQKLFKNYASRVRIISLLPTKYDLALGSLFARV